jgi:hypothetical protein
LKALVVRWLLLTQVKYGGFEVAQLSTTLKTLRFDGEKKGGGEAFGEEGVDISFWKDIFNAICLETW